MKRFAKVMISFIVVTVMLCSMVGVYASGVNTVEGSSLVVDVIDTDGSTVVKSWTDPATTTVNNPIWVTSAQMLRISASLKNGGDITVFSYAIGTTESALANENIQYVGQEGSGTIIKIRPRATLPEGEYVMYIGGENVQTPYSFKYNVGEAKPFLEIESITSRVPKVTKTGDAAVSYKINTALSAATDITDVMINGASIKNKCTVAYDNELNSWKLTIADVGYTYEIGTYTAVVKANGYANTSVEFTVYETLNYEDGNGNVLYTGEIIDNKATLKPAVAHNGAKVASLDRYFTYWTYNEGNYNPENDTHIPVIDGVRNAVIQTATPVDGFTEGDIISKAGAQWVKYKAEGDDTEYDGIRFVALLDYDAMINGYVGVNYNKLSQVTDTELSNLALTSGTGTVSFVKTSTGSPVPSMKVENDALSVGVTGGYWTVGSMYFTPETVRTDAVRNVMTFKFKPYLRDANGNDVVSSGDAYVSFNAVAKKANGTSVMQRAVQWNPSQTEAGEGSFGRGTSPGGSHDAETNLVQPVLDDDGYYYLKMVSFEDSNGVQYSYVYDLNNNGSYVYQHNFSGSETNVAETLGHGFAFTYYKASANSGKNIGVELKEFEMHYEYGDVTTIDHVGVVISNVAKAPTIEAGITKTETTTVYDSIYVRQGDTVTTMDVEDIKAEIKTGNNKFSDSLDSIFYAIAYIPDARKDQKVYATPYVQFKNGSRIYGNAVTDANGNLGVTYNGLRYGVEVDDSGLASADEVLYALSWKASWTEDLGLGNNN